MSVIRMNVPFDTTLYFCLICGYCSRTQNKSCTESNEITLEKPSVNLLEEVEYFRQNTRVTPGNNAPRETSTIKNLWYSQPGETATLFNWTRVGSLDHHTLCLTLANSYENGSIRPWKPGDNPIYNSIGLINVTHADFLLWKEGDSEKLLEAGLIIKN